MQLLNCTKTDCRLYGYIAELRAIFLFGNIIITARIHQISKEFLVHVLRLRVKNVVLTLHQIYMYLIRTIKHLRIKKISNFGAKTYFYLA